MKKLIAIISGVSIAALIGLGDVALADEKDDPKNKEDKAQSLNSTGNEVAVEGIKTPDDGDEGKTIGHVDHGKTTVGGMADGDEGDDALRMKTQISRDSTRPEKRYEKAVDDDEDDSREKKKDKDS